VDSLPRLTSNKVMAFRSVLNGRVIRGTNILIQVRRNDSCSDCRVRLRGFFEAPALAPVDVSATRIISYLAVLASLLGFGKYRIRENWHARGSGRRRTDFVAVRFPRECGFRFMTDGLRGSDQ
jgi:hypothetical protein